jgi:hypothetical protein
MNDLFVRLAKYQPSELRESFENFFTELVAYAIREEPLMRQEFLSALRRGAGDHARAEWTIRTQVPTRSQQRRLTGLRLDLVLESAHETLIVENKIDSALSDGQLTNYLEFASERSDRRVAVVSRDPQSAATACCHQLFLGEVLWSDIAQRWAALQSEKTVGARLLKNVLELMKERNMGPFEPLSLGEIQVPGNRGRLNQKLTTLLGALEARMAEAAPFPEESAVSRRGRFSAGGYWGYGWCAPSSERVAASNFWYFVGFGCDAPLRWAPMMQDTGEADACVFVGMWGGRGAAEGFRAAVRMAAAPLVQGGFEVETSTDASGLFFSRRRPLSSFLDAGDQRTAIIDFLVETHRSAVATGALPKIYERFLSHTGGRPVARDGENGEGDTTA